jgi:hypothetical protein
LGDFDKIFQGRVTEHSENGIEDKEEEAADNKEYCY